MVGPEEASWREGAATLDSLACSGWEGGGGWDRERDPPSSSRVSFSLFFPERSSRPLLSRLSPLSARGSRWALWPPRGDPRDPSRSSRSLSLREDFGDSFASLLLDLENFDL